MNEIHGRSRLFQRLAWLNAAAGIALIAAFAMQGIDQPSLVGCTEKIIDFHVFWAAARFSLEGTPLLAFDQEALRAAFGACTMTWLPWVHPAPAMLLLSPLGALPFLAAWATFGALSLAALALSLRSFTSNHSGLFIAALFAPAMLPALLGGQFTVLWIAGLLGAIAALRAERPILAGIFIGLLTIKPTLGLLIPAALVAIWAFRTIIAATITTILVHGAATVLYGIEYWSTWRDVSSNHARGIIEEMGTRDNMSSISAFLAHLGMAPQTAVIINFGCTLILAIVVFLVWRKYTVKSDIAVAVLFAAIPVATPYLWHYDAAFLAIAALFVIKSRSVTIGPLLAIALFVVWLGPGLSVWYAATIGLGTLTPAFTIPPILLLALGLALAPVVSKSSYKFT